MEAEDFFPDPPSDEIYLHDFDVDTIAEIVDLLPSAPPKCAVPLPSSLLCPPSACDSGKHRAATTAAAAVTPNPGDALLAKEAADQLVRNRAERSRLKCASSRTKSASERAARSSPLGSRASSPTVSKSPSPASSHSSSRDQSPARHAEPPSSPQRQQQQQMHEGIAMAVRSLTMGSLAMDDSELLRPPVPTHRLRPPLSKPLPGLGAPPSCMHAHLQVPPNCASPSHQPPMATALGAQGGGALGGTLGGGDRGDGAHATSANDWQAQLWNALAQAPRAWTPHAGAPSVPHAGMGNGGVFPSRGATAATTPPQCVVTPFAPSPPVANRACTSPGGACLQPAAAPDAQSSAVKQVEAQLAAMRGQSLHEQSKARQVEAQLLAERNRACCAGQACATHSVQYQQLGGAGFCTGALGSSTLARAPSGEAVRAPGGAAPGFGGDAAPALGLPSRPSGEAPAPAPAPGGVVRGLLAQSELSMPLTPPISAPLPNNQRSAPPPTQLRAPLPTSLSAPLTTQLNAPLAAQPSAHFSLPKPPTIATMARLNPSKPVQKSELTSSFLPSSKPPAQT